jgi:hypothetical protein
MARLRVYVCFEFVCPYQQVDISARTQLCPADLNKKGISLLGVSEVCF